MGMTEAHMFDNDSGAGRDVGCLYLPCLRAWTRQYASSSHQDDDW